MMPEHPEFSRLLNLRSAGSLAEILSGSDVLAILSGHHHSSLAASWHGRPVSAAPATAYLLDPGVEDELVGLDGSGFHLCAISGRELIVTPVFLPGSGRELFRYSPEHLRRLIAH
jgi:hypothetical protein